jgi:energy-coupling factor transporter ATP-binding protein EcfA2
MYFYNAYGLGIHSAFSLPELVTASPIKADVVIQLGKVDRSLSEISMRGYLFHMSAESAYFFWEHLGTFLVRDGKEIIVDPLPGVEECLVRLPIVGMAMAVLLHQRGYLTLHASAVAINGGVVAFMGRKGQGKSTIAATLYGRGHHMIADDMIALDLDETGCPMVLPGFPQFKLWPDAAVAALGDDPEVLPRLFSGYEKRARHAVDRFSHRPLPLKRIYLISEGPALEIKPLQPQEAIIQLINQSYIARVAHPLIQGVGACSHFLQCTSLIKSTPVYRLKRPNSLPMLSVIAQLLEKHLTDDIHLARV